MDTTSQNISAQFSPETAFAIALTETTPPPQSAEETSVRHYLAMPSEDQFTRRGIPESALHD